MARTAGFRVRAAPPGVDRAYFRRHRDQALRAAAATSLQDRPPEGRLLVAPMYPFGYLGVVTTRNILEQARDAAGLSQAALAARSGTSRPTLSAYEHGRKSPTLDTAQRILREAGFDLAISPRIEFREVALERGRPIRVPNALPRLPLERALATIELPLHLNWSDRGRRYDLRDRRQRARVYEVVLREGRPVDVLGHIDGALLVDLWGELVLPPAIRDAWNAVVSGEVDEGVA